MGLKFSDALRLSWSNIAQHKKRSVLIVITISVLFMLIVGLNLVFQGVEDTVLEAATEAGDGKIYVETGFVPAYQGVSNPAEYLPGDADEIVRKRIERYHGKYVGKVVEYDFENIEVKESEEYGRVTHYMPDNYRVINYGAIEEFCTTELTEVPEGKLPVLMMKDATLSQEEEEIFYAVGELPLPDKISLALPGGFNFLNLALGDSAGHSYTDFMRDFLIIEDENSGLVADFIAQRTAEMQRQEEEATGSAYHEVGIIEYPVAVFESPKDFLDYYDRTNVDGREYDYNCDYAHSYYCRTRDLFGNAASVAASFLYAKYILNLIGALLLVIAVCVAAMTLSHVIDEDAATIALYRSMGASSGGIYLIYFCYLVELCLLAILACFAISFLFAGVLALMNAGVLGNTLYQAYDLVEVPPVRMIGWNAQVLYALVAILLVAPLTLLMTIRRFSPKYIAKKLKDD